MILLILSLIICLFGLVLASIRLLLGPDLPSRILAFDLIGVFGLAGLVMLAIYYDNLMWLDIGLSLAFSGFIGTIIVTKLIKIDSNKGS